MASVTKVHLHCANLDIPGVSWNDFPLNVYAIRVIAESLPMDDSPIFKSSTTPIYFDAFISQEGLLSDEAKQLETDDEELLRRASSKLSDEEEVVDHLSPLSSPPPELSKSLPRPPPLLTIQPPGKNLNSG